MSTALNNIKELIKQEQWTRDASSFTQKSLIELDSILSELDNDEKNELLQFAEEHIKSNKKSLHALYALGTIDLTKSSIHDEHMIRLIDIFSEASKWDMVEQLCNKLLSHNNNLNALHKLATAYEHTGKKEELLTLWEKISQIDFEDANVCHKIADYKAEAGDMEAAIKEYKKALNRYIIRKDFTNIRKVWTILLEKDTENIDVDFYLTFEQKAERTLSKDRSEELLIALLSALNNTPENYDVKITILKRLLKLNPESMLHRETLVNLYREKYSDNPKIEDFIQMSNLNQAWRNIREAVSDFEKHISFFPGSFVYHNKWGIGRIKEATHQYLTIDFTKKRDHQMEISMAVSSLDVLPKDHFWVLRSALPKEKLAHKILNDPIWGLKKIIQSLGSADMKVIKAELVPHLLSKTEWTSWSKKAKKILEDSPSFGVLPEKAKHYVFSDTPVSELTKRYDIFKKEKNFINKIKMFRDIINQDMFSNTDDKADIEIFWQIFEYFNSFLKKDDSEDTTRNSKQKSEEFRGYIHSLFVCDEALKNTPHTSRKPEKDFATEIANMSIDQLKVVIRELIIEPYQDLLFEYVLEHRDDWKEIYINLMPFHHTEKVIKNLEKAGETEFLMELYQTLEQNFQNHKKAFVWFTITQSEKDWFTETDSFKIIGNLFRTCALVYKDIQGKPKGKTVKGKTKAKDYSDLLAQIVSFLEKNEQTTQLFREKDRNDIEYLYSLARELSEIIPNTILEIRTIIEERFPDFVFNDKFDVDEDASATSFFALPQSYKRKQQELQHIHDVEVPANSKEIEKARSFGDLKENAEYKAAKEHQDSLNTKAATIKQELEHAKLFDKENLNSDSVGFGTKIQVHDKNEDSTKTYILLGPWESDPDRDIISYLSPLGQKLYKKKLGEVCDFIINDVDYVFEIKSIETVDLDTIV